MAGEEKLHVITKGLDIALKLHCLVLRKYKL